MQQEGKVVGENSVKLAPDSTRHQLLAVLGYGQGHYSAIELSLVRHVPFSVSNIEPFELSISASNID